MFLLMVSMRASGYTCSGKKPSEDVEGAATRQELVNVLSRHFFFLEKIVAQGSVQGRNDWRQTASRVLHGGARLAAEQSPKISKLAQRS